MREVRVSLRRDALASVLLKLDLERMHHQFLSAVPTVAEVRVAALAVASHQQSVRGPADPALPPGSARIERVRCFLLCALQYPGHTVGSGERVMEKIRGARPPPGNTVTPAGEYRRCVTAVTPRRGSAAGRVVEAT
jgi:hypothetical protein